MLSLCTGNHPFLGLHYILTILLKRISAKWEYINLFNKWYKIPPGYGLNTWCGYPGPKQQLAFFLACSRTAILSEIAWSSSRLSAILLRPASDVARSRLCNCFICNYNNSIRLRFWEFLDHSGKSLTLFCVCHCDWKRASRWRREGLEYKLNFAIFLLKE